MTSRLSIFFALAVAFAPALAVAQAAGPAAQAAERWYATDLSLGCVASNGSTVTCGPVTGPVRHLFSGSADGGAGQPDAVALVLYNTSTEGSGHFAAMAQFRQEGGQFRFVRKLPYPVGEALAPGSQVRFGGGKVTVTIEVLKPTDPRCCPTGRKVVALSLR